ncbi:hypothetical protein Zmor_022545 [Zophobas morio]|uniref:Uncharacterized protein n=1 Tax=Zophobas morio TaxID=2755281 RepID=A0AA38M6H0_9CUCU|nr:hypothetical protein Zmor_022545 [Zophobas morio]
MSEDNILDFFEREKSIKLPLHVKNLLLLAGFDNKISLSKLEVEDITELERIGREIVPYIIDKPDHEKYLGYFKNYPQGFCIFSGHKKLLQEMSQFYKNFSNKKRVLTDASDTPAKKTPEQVQIEGHPRTSTKPRDVDSEKQNIYSLLMNWISNFCSRNLTFEEAAHVSKEINKMKVDISHEDPNQCFVTCCICLRELKIFRNQNGFWIMSNIHKHFKTHLNTYSNKKFSKNISISSSISNTASQENDAIYVVENEIKQEDCEEN